MTKYEILVAGKAEKYLEGLKGKNEAYKALIIMTNKFCLGEHLLDRNTSCNMKKIKGTKRTHRLHVQRAYTVFYVVEKTKEKTVVEVHLITTYEEAHQLYGRIDL